MNRPRVTCPRCGRDCAAAGWDPVDAAVPVRHKDENREWCPGRPKTRNELVADLIRSVMAERAALREYTDEFLRHGDEIVRITTKHAEASVTSTEIMKQITATYDTDIAAAEADIAAAEAGA